jgi:ubiquinone biosynthesis protein COQ4
VHYSDSSPLRHARAEYFRENAFGEDGGYGQRWVKVKLGLVPIWFLNTDGRRRAVRLHDLHHIATGYDTSLVGEAEIGAWELATGCADYYAAWLLNAAAVTMGVFLAPRRVWHAFERGRGCTNLYRVGFEDRWLDETVGALRERLGLRDVQGRAAA